MTAKPAPASGIKSVVDLGATIEKWVSRITGILVVVVGAFFAVTGAPVFKKDMDAALADRDGRIFALEVKTDRHGAQIDEAARSVQAVKETQARIDERTKAIAAGIARLEDRQQ